MHRKILPCKRILTLTLSLSLLVFQYVYAQEKCDDWIIEILSDSTDLLNDQMTVEWSSRGECGPATDELFKRQFLAVMKPEMFAESRLAFSVWRQCMDQHMDDAQACTKAGSTVQCPPSDECNEVQARYQCVFNTAKSYEILWNKLQERQADELVEELSDKKCVGDESDMWHAINEMWETLKQRNPDTGADQ